MTTSDGPVGRLAPTPSGDLHLGNATAFAAAWLSVRQAGGRLLLRFEDVDRGRARTEVEARQRDDLRWLRLGWDAEVAPQRDRDYEPWLRRLAHRTYRCRCSRQAVAQRGHAPDGGCPGGCRDAGHRTGAVRFRLEPGDAVTRDRARGVVRGDPARLGDPVLQRADGCATYTLAVVADDLVDGVSEVVRGADLVDFALVQEQVWAALGATPPTWLHAPLILGPDGRKLSKSHQSREIRALRAAGWTPDDVWRCIAPWLGLAEVPWTAAVAAFRPGGVPRGPFVAPTPD